MIGRVHLMNIQSEIECDWTDFIDEYACCHLLFPCVSASMLFLCKIKQNSSVMHNHELRLSGKLGINLYHTQMKPMLRNYTENAPISTGTHFHRDLSEVWLNH